jgi:hypothetical protein
MMAENEETTLPFPAELRNMIYELVLIKEELVLITSPRNTRYLKKQKHTDFASLLMVNTKVSGEAKRIFYSFNTFVIGNGHWGATTQPNLHGFNGFTSGVPDKYIALIRKIELDMFSSYIKLPAKPKHDYLIRKEDVRQMRRITRKLLKISWDLGLSS